MGATDMTPEGRGPRARLPLLAQREFAPLFWCQFFAAFNDNFLKNALVFLILFGIGGQGRVAQGGAALVTIAGGVFILPFFLLSGLGGELADRMDKARLAQRLKAIEIAAATLAMAGFVLRSVPVLFAALLAFGILSALFGPVKYAILPERLPQNRLNAANALVEFATFIAILGGTIAGGAAAAGGNAAWFAALVMLFALLAWGFAARIPPGVAAAPGLRLRANILASSLGLVAQLYAFRPSFVAALFTCWFWLVGSVALALLPALVQQSFGGDPLVVTLGLSVFSIGVGLGSALATWLAAGRILLLLCPMAALLMAVALGDIGWTTEGLASFRSLASLPPAASGLRGFLAQAGAVRLLADLALLAAAGGLLVVPSFAAVQAWAGPERRARAVAAVNVLTAAVMVAGAVALAAAQFAGMMPPALFGALGLGSLLVAGIMLAWLPVSARDDLRAILRRRRAAAD